MHRGLSPTSSEMAWQTALRQVLEVTHEPLSHAKVGWAVIGSGASTLQGCRLPPADIDILFAEPEGVHQFAQFMSVFAVPRRPREGELWLSSREQPVAFEPPDPQKEVWNFGRWMIADCKIEAAHIARPAGDPSMAQDWICEPGPRIWPHIRHVPFGRYQVPVVPLEIRLGTELLRERKERVDEIVAVLQGQGHDRELLRQALSRQHLAVAERLLTYNSEDTKCR